MIDSLYGKYFQKSRSFLYPALGIKKDNTTNPTGTYISIDGKLGPEEMKLVCVYKADDSESFKEFENQMLLSNPLFREVMHIDNYRLYIFDFEMYKHDWFNFLMGKYSKLSPVLKKAIKHYYGENSSEYGYIDSYLNPDKYFAVYATLLDVDVSLLKNIGELCDPCDLDKETLKYPKKDLENL